MTRDEMWKEFENQLKREVHTPMTMSYDDSVRCAELGIEEVVTKWKERLEQGPILDKIKAEILDTLYVDSLIFGELIDFKNGKIDADDVIEKFNRITEIEVLEIIDKYKAESEE